MNKQEEASGESAEGYSKGYLRYALGLFLLVYIVNFIDRQIFSILIEPIKAEIELSDTQLGLLGGIAFALFYTFAGIPIARWADVGTRKNIVALAIFIWSAMTMMTSTAKSFGGLLLARVGVGIGEAGCSPPIHSMISDYFPESKRATALATYAMGIPIGGAIGTLAGGWIGEYYGWRMAFLLVGLPGILLSFVVYFTIREPLRGSVKPVINKPVEPAFTLVETMRFMASLRSFRHLSFAGALHAFVGYGVGLFMPAYFMRIHGYGLAETSSYLFLIGLTGILGTYLGGYLGDRFGQKDKRWYMLFPGVATFLSVPFAFLFYTTDVPWLALLFAIPGAILGPMYLGPTFGMTQTLVPPKMRATASAILLFVLNLIGLGLGPVFAGALSDYLTADYGVEAIRYALLILAVAGNIWAALHYYLASRTIQNDMQLKDAPALQR